MEVISSYNLHSNEKYPNTQYDKGIYSSDNAIAKFSEDHSLHYRPSSSEQAHMNQKSYQKADLNEYFPLW